MTDPDLEATMRYSWLPDVGKTGVIYADYGLIVTGSFALLVFGEGVEDRGKVLEDGIRINLGPASWDKLKASIASFQPAKIFLDKDTMLTVSFIRTTTFDPLLPKSFFPASLQLYQSPDEQKARMGEGSPLTDYAKLFEKAASASLAETQKQDACGVMIAVVLKPGKLTRVWCEAVDGSLSDDTLKKLSEELGKIPPLEVKDGPVAFTLKGTLWDRKVKEFPEFPKAWAEAISASGKPYTSLDELVKIIWPDK